MGDTFRNMSTVVLQLRAILERKRERGGSCCLTQHLRQASEAAIQSASRHTPDPPQGNAYPAKRNSAMIRPHHRLPPPPPPRLHCLCILYQAQVQLPGLCISWTICGPRAHPTLPDARLGYYVRTFRSATPSCWSNFGNFFTTHASALLAAGQENNTISQYG